MPGPPSGRGFGTPAVKSVYLNPFSTESVQGRHRRHLLPHLSCRFGNECQTTYIMMIPAPRKVSARRRQHGQRSSRRATHLPRIGAGKQKTTPRKKKPRTRGSSHGEITSAAKIQSRANTRENSHQLLRLGIQARDCSDPSGIVPDQVAVGSGKKFLNNCIAGSLGFIDKRKLASHTPASLKSRVDPDGKLPDSTLEFGPRDQLVQVRCRGSFCL